MPRIPSVSLPLLPLVALLCAAPAAADALSVDDGLLADAALLLAREAGLDAQAQSGTGPRKTTTRKTDPEPAPLIAPGSGVGIGLQVGTPTALTLKLPTAGADIVLGIGVGYGYRNRGFAGLSIHGDYLFTVATLVPGDLNVTAYIGPGLWLTLFQGGYGYGLGYYYSRETFLGLGVRLPIGVNARFATAPIEIYLELDPAIFVFPGLDPFLGASLGFRWFF